jgi:maltooligosyltrehalose synthase
MSWMPEQEPTPLRLRLGPRSEVPLRPAFEDALSDSPLDPANDDGRPMPIEPETHAAAETAPGDAKDPLRAAASEELQRAIEQTSERVERWMADQRRRLGIGIDAMVASLKEQRDTELSRIEEWKTAERERAERQLAEEKERFHGQLMQELVEFEQQLGERLREQEERLAKWWDEAEQLTKKRFADFGLSSEASDSPTA